MGLLAAHINDRTAAWQKKLGITLLRSELHQISRKKRAQAAKQRTWTSLGIRAVTGMPAAQNKDRITVYPQAAVPLARGMKLYQ